LVDVLRTRVTTIGLNGHHANQAAIECYRALGFEVVAEYHEWSFEPSHPIRR
jgi:ribosomal protein S18 acetylase RimI-like enzyme